MERKFFNEKWFLKWFLILLYILYSKINVLFLSIHWLIKKKVEFTRVIYMPFWSLRCHFVSGAKSHVCSVNPTNLVLWFETLLAMWYHMFVCFSYHIPLVHHKNKSHSLESRLWKDISTSNFTVKLLQQNIRVWPWGSTQNVSWQIDWFPDYHISVFDLIIN